MKPFVPDVLPLNSLNWERLVPRIGPANRALAGFGGILHGLRNADLLLAPLTTREAVLSSKIEGTQTTLSEVLRFEAGQAPDSAERQEDIREVLNYRSALRYAADALRKKPFHLNLLLKLHSILLDSVRGQNRGRGCVRTVQNWIGPPGCSMEEASFVPPEPLALPPALGNWEKYYHADERDALVQLAVLHAQFEILHPFVDGNGRLGRILVPLFLFERELLPRPAFYLSDYLDRHREQYIRGLNEIGKNPTGWEEWIAFFLEAIRIQATENLEKARNVLALHEDLRIAIGEQIESRHALDILDAFFERPILSSSDLSAKPGAPTRQTVSAILSKLRQKGIVQMVSEPKGRRPGLFALEPLLEILEGPQPTPAARGKRRLIKPGVRASRNQAG